MHVGMPIKVKLLKKKNWKEQRKISFGPTETIDPKVDPS